MSGFGSRFSTLQAALSSTLLPKYSHVTISGALWGVVDAAFAQVGSGAQFVQLRGLKRQIGINRPKLKSKKEYPIFHHDTRSKPPSLPRSATLKTYGGLPVSHLLKSRSLFPKGTALAPAASPFSNTKPRLYGRDWEAESQVRAEREAQHKLRGLYQAEQAKDRELNKEEVWKYGKSTRRLPYMRGVDHRIGLDTAYYNGRFIVDRNGVMWHRRKGFGKRMHRRSAGSRDRLRLLAPLQNNQMKKLRNMGFTNKYWMSPDDSSVPGFNHPPPALWADFVEKPPPIKILWGIVQPRSTIELRQRLAFAFKDEVPAIDPKEKRKAPWWQKQTSE